MPSLKELIQHAMKLDEKNNQASKPTEKQKAGGTLFPEKPEAKRRGRPLKTDADKD